MKINKVYTLLFAAAMFGFVACESAKTEEVVEETPVEEVAEEVVEAPAADMAAPAEAAPAQ